MNVPIRNMVFPKSPNTCLKTCVLSEINFEWLHFIEFVFSFKKTMAFLTLYCC